MIIEDPPGSARQLGANAGRVARQMTDGERVSAREIISDLYDYAAWANARLLDLAGRLPDSDLRRRFTQGALPVLDNFVHLASADRRWFARWQQVPLPAGLTVADLPSVAAVRQVFEDIDAARRALHRRARRHGARRRPSDGRTAPRRGRCSRWQALIQCANHGTQHRSEIAAMLTDCRSLSGRPRLRPLVPAGQIVGRPAEAMAPADHLMDGRGAPPPRPGAAGAGLVYIVLATDVNL